MAETKNMFIELKKITTERIYLDGMDVEEVKTMIDTLSPRRLVRELIYTHYCQSMDISSDDYYLTPDDVQSEVATVILYGTDENDKLVPLYNNLDNEPEDVEP